MKTRREIEEGKGLKWQMRILSYMIIIFITAIILTMVSCSKEDQEVCKTCKTVVRYEPDTGGEYREEDTIQDDCNNPQDNVTKEHGTYEFKLWWIEKDSSITITGTKITAKRCN